MGVTPSQPPKERAGAGRAGTRALAMSSAPG